MSKFILLLAAFALAFVGFAQGQVQPPRQGLFAYYPLDEPLGVDDFSGFANHGTANNISYGQDAAGLQGSAAYFNATNAWFTGPSLNTAGAITVGMVLQPAAAQNAVITYIGSTAANGFGIRFGTAGSGAAGTDIMVLQGGVAETRNTGPNRYPVGQWCHLTMVRASDSIRVYVNGRKVLATLARPNNTTAPVYFGHDAFSTSTTRPTYNGMMDNARIYLRALSDNEVLQLAQADLPTLFTALAAPRQLNLQAYPQPFTDRLSVGVQSAGNGTVRLLDAQSRLVVQAQLQQGRADLPTASLPAGMYLLEVATAGGLHRRRVVRQ